MCTKAQKTPAVASCCLRSHPPLQRHHRTPSLHYSRVAPPLPGRDPSSYPALPWGSAAVVGARGEDWPEGRCLRTRLWWGWFKGAQASRWSTLAYCGMGRIWLAALTFALLDLSQGSWQCHCGLWQGHVLELLWRWCKCSLSRTFFTKFACAATGSVFSCPVVHGAVIEEEQKNLRVVASG